MVIECSELNQSSKKGEGAIPNMLPNCKQNILSKKKIVGICVQLHAIILCFFNQCNQSICHLDQLNAEFRIELCILGFP